MGKTKHFKPIANQSPKQSQRQLPYQHFKKHPGSQNTKTCFLFDRNPKRRLVKFLPSSLLPPSPQNPSRNKFPKNTLQKTNSKNKLPKTNSPKKKKLSQKNLKLDPQNHLFLFKKTSTFEKQAVKDMKKTKSTKQIPKSPKTDPKTNPPSQKKQKT